MIDIYSPKRNKTIRELVNYTSKQIKKEFGQKAADEYLEMHYGLWYGTTLLGRQPTAIICDDLK